MWHLAGRVIHRGLRVTAVEFMFAPSLAITAMLRLNVLVCSAICMTLLSCHSGYVLHNGKYEVVVAITGRLGSTKIEDIRGSTCKYYTKDHTSK